MQISKLGSQDKLICLAGILWAFKVQRKAVGGETTDSANHTPAYYNLRGLQWLLILKCDLTAFLYARCGIKNNACHLGTQTLSFEILCEAVCIIKVMLSLSNINILFQCSLFGPVQSELTKKCHFNFFFFLCFAWSEWDEIWWLLL